MSRKAQKRHLNQQILPLFITGLAYVMLSEEISDLLEHVKSLLV